MSDYIASIDIGTSKICTIISELDRNGKVQIIGIGKAQCEGIRKGVVVDIESTAKSISESVEQAENMADVEINQVYVNIPGGYTSIIRNKGIIAVSNDNREIGVDDIKRVLNSATIISVPPDRQIVDIVPVQYIVDGYDEISDPTGMFGVRLEADVEIVTASLTTIQNLVKSVNKAGLEVLGIIMEPLATSESVLTKDETELGVLLIDIGAGTTDFSVFKDGNIVYSGLIPAAGNHITNDISIGLRLAVKESEDIKRKYGLAYTGLAKNDNIFEATPIGLNEKIKIPELQLAEIIEARVGEIFEIINNELMKLGLKNEILAGVVITGGGISYLRGVKELGRILFDLPIRVGQPSGLGVKDPIFSASVGMINYSLKRKFNYYIEYNNVEKKRMRNKSRNKEENKVVSIFKKLWNDYF
ncbi:cell division protein FtsA [Proteiniborus ethanoligenes]|uniref:Cell division protein FtsA n=1 Tax=Proteiniborus ethanoligenes TaxID=415015 RepID=A0A1H3JWQ9_9FIRM|nr:cell division protein FtsA [Proteiniborus ethanoligenes]SDY44366.1 cell division protein FtsA [Proteiniborus ethanoligenes]